MDTEPVTLVDTLAVRRVERLLDFGGIVTGGTYIVEDVEVVVTTVPRHPARG